MSSPRKHRVSSPPLLKLGMAWICCLLGSASLALGQVIETSPSLPIIQSPPGTETTTPAASGNSEPTSLFTDLLTVERVQLRIQEVSDDPTLDKAKKENLIGLYQRMIADLTEAANQEAKAAVFVQDTQAIPAKLEEAKQAKQSLGKPARVEIPKDASLALLQQELSQREEELAQVKKKLDETVDKLKNITAKRAELAQTKKTLQDHLAATEESLKKLPANGNANREALAERNQHRTRWQLLRASLVRLDKEDALRQARTELLPLERDIAALEAARLESEVQAWRTAVTAERQAELERQKAQAEAQARQALTFEEYASIAEHANEIVELAEHRQKTTARMSEVLKELDKLTNHWRTLSDSFRQSRERVKAAGSTMNVGTLLRLQQKKLPNLRELEFDIHSRQDEIQRIQLASYEVNDRTKELANVTKAVEELLESLDPRPAPEEFDRLQSFVTELLETEKNHLDNLNADYNDLLDKLWRLDKVEKQLIEETKSYSQFISEHVLWIRSTDPLWDRPVEDFQEAFAWLLRTETWVSVLAAWGRDFWENPGPWILAVALFGLLLIQQRKLKRRITEIGKTINKRAMTEFLPTFHALVDTVLIAMLWPALLCWMGYRLFQHLEASMAVSAVGWALFALGLIFFPVELLRQSCRTNGLVQSHFTWPAPVVTMIRRNLRWLKLFAPPFALIAVLFHSAEGEASAAHESLGRLCFAVGLLLTAWFLHRVLRPSGAAFRALVANSQGGWIDRLKYVFYSAGVLVPVALACLAVVGYHFTAEQLVIRVYATVLLTLFVLIVDALVQRWLLITRRRLAMDQLRQRREAAIAQAEQAAAAGATPGAQSPLVSNPLDTPDERLDVAEMNVQTRQLIRSLVLVGIVVGLWGVWVDVLPALAVLKNVKIQALTIERVIEEPLQSVAETPAPDHDAPLAEDAPEQPPETVPRTIRVPITLADLILSILLLIVAIAAARNLPGMLEMVVLQRLPIDNAARYAITTLSQYGLMFFGISAAFYVVGLRWQNVQWLAAALMLGLGFGLQEIFANFFSGLIVLLERPVRVGDIVTVGNTTGIVSKIRMRATTITNWERQEMIIPNKELITGTVLNWTLSDNIQRVFIQVGLAYGSNTDKATEVLYEVLKSHPQVMEDPPPVVTFAGFGDSTLKFELRCYLPTAAVRLATTHELHTSIDRAFREAGIEIAFPQCDLHIRSVETAIPFHQMTHAPSHGRSQDAALSKGA